MSTVVVPLAEGFEELEAVAVIDILRRAGVTVIVAGLDQLTVTGSHGLSVQTDKLLSEVSALALDGIVLPGGQPGTSHLLKNATVRQMVLEQDRQEHLVGAICAAPTVLNAAGVLSGRRATSFPSTEKEMAGTVYCTDEVVEDGNIITSRGAGTAVAFGLALVKKLCGAKKTADIADAIVHKGWRP